MKKVLFIVNSLSFFISHRKPIADRLISEGYEVHLAAGKTDDTVPDSIIWHELPLERGGTNIFHEFQTFLDIYSVIKRVNPNLLHFVSIKPVIYGGIILNFLPRIPAVSAISGLGSIFTNQSKFKFLYFIVSSLYKIALKRSNLIIIFQNEEDKKIIKKLTNIPESRTRLIRGSGVDLKKYNYSPEPLVLPNVKVTMASRLLKDKGVVEFIEAAELLKEENIHFLIIGDIDTQNPESLNFEDVQKYSINPKLNFIGHKYNIQDYFANSHIIVLPSYREGLPKVLCEAASCGRAVITTDVPGCRDAIISGVTGLLVPAKNSSALAMAIQKLAKDDAERRSMGNQGRKLAVSEFDINIIVDKHLQIYKELGL